MKSPAKVALLLVAVGLVSLLSCLVTRYLLPIETARPTQDFHTLLHERLNLTSQQDHDLDVEEETFAVTKKELSEKLNQANRNLAQTITEDREYSPRVEAAVERVHHAQSELEMATLKHIFAMKPILTPEQFDKLLALTHDALSNPAQP